MNAIVTVPAYAVSDLEMMARAFSASKMFGVTTPDQALALCLVAQAEGRHPASAAMDYSIIQNRPAKKADAMLRDFISAGGKVQWHTLDNATADATFSHPSGGSVRIEWTMERAKAAGLGGKDMWKKYPRQMLRSRTVSEGVRTVCPGATSGMYVPEEVQDFAPEVQQLRDVTDEAMEGTPQIPKSAHQARKDGDYERLTAGMRDAAKVDEAALTAWAKEQADEIGALPHGWRGELRKEYGELLVEVRARAADPFGLHIEPPADDAEQGSWLEYVEDVLAAIAGAPDEEQVTAAQTINAAGLTVASIAIEGVAERIAEAAEQRLGALAMKDAA